jgi:hypothetical protein
MTDTPKIVPGRSCSGCAMCCKLPSIAALDKPSGVWCRHCQPGKSDACTAYEARPDACRTFHCGYLLNPNLDEAWKPSKSKMMLTFEGYANRIVIHVDPARADAWRREPFYSTIKEWADVAARGDGQVLIWIGKRAFGILPHIDKDLGEISDDQVIVSSQKHGIVSDFFVVHKDDPVAQRLCGGGQPS